MLIKPSIGRIVGNQHFQCIGEITNDKTVSKVSYQYPSKCKMPRLSDLAILLGH